MLVPAGRDGSVCLCGERSFNSSSSDILILLEVLEEVQSVSDWW